MTELTLPHERTRSVIKTEEFLRELARSAELPQEVRSHAKSLLRHYPSAGQIFSVGRLEECLMSSGSEDELRRRVTAFHQRLFSSSLDFTL
ncbi:BPSL0761 family protein [Pseudomonas sp. BGI-2]|uniref:BPSL0761 family protein n=1 Tax=Pseudomonas sp. BGI-2 TaxID=2528211 RepID=UPI00273FE626|nr:BPSL0761 family protein [Pseudomonas sp. BGI-2]